MGTIPKNKKIFLIQVFAIPTLICILFCMEWMRVYAADVRPSEVAAGETFNAGYTGVTNCALRIRFYRYKDDAESRLNYSLSNPYESEVKGYDQYDSGEDVTAPSIDGSTNGVKWHKYGEGETSDLDRNYYYDVTYYAELPIVINFDQNYQTSPDHYDSPIMCASSGVFANPSDKVEVTLNPALTREGYSFLGWSKNEEAQTADYAAGSKYRVGVNERNQLMYAVWQRKPVNVTVQYSPNGGTGDTINKSISVTLSDDVSGNFALLDSAAFKRENYKLTGWSDEDGTIYDLGSKYGFMVPNTETTASFSFDAVWTEKTAGEVDIDVKKPVYVGAEFKYDIDKNSDGDVKLEYKKKGAKDDDYTKKVPTEPGKYTVRATLEETDDYTSAEDTTDFDISYLSAPDAPYSYQEIKNSAGTVTDLKIVSAEGYSIGLTGAVDASFGSSVLYSAAKKAGGVYLKRDDGAITEQVQLTEYSVKDTPSITVKERVYYGEKFSVTASSKSPADKTITYAKTGSSNSSFTSTVPTEPGKYTVRLTAPASGFYAAVDEKMDFEIVYLETPGKLAYLDGKPGDKGWFRSEVKIKAPTGYEISTTLTGTYSTSIDWSDKITKLYYRRTSDGATTDGINFNPDAKIDGDAPSVNFEGSLKVNSEKKVSVFLDEMTFTIVDDNLYEVTVDGVKQTVSHGRCEIKLAAGTDTETLKVVAKDEAGNTYEFTIELSPQWMETNTMPVGRQVTLKSNIAYSFASGSDYMIDNDDTVYAGGNQFYVKGNMSCTISQKTKAK